MSSVSTADACPRPITVAALTAMGKLDQLKFHLGFARQNGVTDDELKEALLHLAFYSGCPNGTGPRRC